MESFEALAAAINRNTVRHAKALHLCTSSVNKWQEPSVDFNDSGSFNPLDRIETIIKTSIDLGSPPDVAFAPIQFLATRFNLCVIPLPAITPSLSDIAAQIYTTTREFADLIKVSSEVVDDGRISRDARLLIEREGNHLLSAVGVLMRMVQEAAK